MIVCPSCGANLKFDPKSQKMLCEFCGSSFDPSEFDMQGDAQEQVIQEENTEAPEFETYDVTIFTCPQCGGELMSVDDNTAAAFCSFCGASTILNSRLAKGKKPEFIIPFKKTKEDCKKAYLNIVKKALFLPKEYRSEDCIDSFRGIYMPYWSYDVKQKGQVRLSGETSHRSGDYIITDHYALSGDVDAEYDGLSYDSSSAFEDSISEALAPFNVKERVPFETSYMSGYYADLADVDAGVYKWQAEKFAYETSLNRIKNETREFKKYSITTPITPSSSQMGNAAVPTRSDKGHSSMYPVWFMSYRNGDRVAYAAVNGQTGKVVADLPIDVKKYLLSSGIIALIIFAILNLFLVMTPTVALVVASILTILVFIINASQRSEIRKAALGEGDKGKESMKKKEAKPQKGKKQKEERVEEAESTGLEKITMFLGIGAVVISALMIFMVKPISDVPYYVMCIVEAVFFGLSFKHTLGNYNIMATRRLPQFDRKGGDDRA
ncbi:MAG: hypothetical protein K5857_06095 [Lachnospiraceae bacterium]|nr:hypothetical protein [Lachnospiraceae bacterium]